jgi:hypothetical protein
LVTKVVSLSPNGGIELLSKFVVDRFHIRKFEVSEKSNKFFLKDLTFVVISLLYTSIKVKLFLYGWKEFEIGGRDEKGNFDR